MTHESKIWIAALSLIALIATVGFLIVRSHNAGLRYGDEQSELRQKAGCDLAKATDMYATGC